MTMKKIQILIFLSVLLLSSCDKIEKAISDAAQNNEQKGGKKIKDGVVKQYRKNGVLKTEVSYKDGIRHGLAKSYYKNGKLRQEINYAKNQKDGTAKTYYQNGKLYQTTPYVNDTIHGFRKKYRQNGKLMAEIPYNKGTVCAGLKEYLINGEPRKRYPVIEIQEIDQLVIKNKFTVRLKMSDGSKNVKFYDGSLTADGCISNDLLWLSSNTPGMLDLVYDVPPGMFMMKELTFTAQVKTKLGNPFITQKRYNLALDN